MMGVKAGKINVNEFDWFHGIYWVDGISCCLYTKVLPNVDDVDFVGDDNFHGFPIKTVEVVFVPVEEEDGGKFRKEHTYHFHPYYMLMEYEDDRRKFDYEKPVDYYAYQYANRFIHSQEKPPACSFWAVMDFLTEQLKEYKQFKEEDKDE